MKNTFHIRVMSCGDLPYVEAIERLAYSDSLMEPLEVLRCKASITPELDFVCQDGDVIIGYLIAYQSPVNHVGKLNCCDCSIPKGKAWYIHDLAVAPAYRGQGIARALLSHVFAAARSLKLFEATLVSVQGSKGLYERFGFHAVTDMSVSQKTIMDDYGPDAVLMKAVMSESL